MNTHLGKQQHTSRHSHGLPALRRKLLPASLISLLGLFACGGEAFAGGHVAANTTPTGGSIVGGSGSIAQNGANTTVVQKSQMLALNWQTFNVGENASVVFKQPAFTSVALNRILDQNASQIFGHVNANGQIFLINTHGIIFGRNSQVNVGGLVASTLDLTPSDFLANHFNLDAHGGSAGVVNHGIIEAASGGSVSLIGGQVANDGLIVANYGHINLDGADRAVLDFDGDGLIDVQVTGALEKRLNADEAAVTNKGTLKADSGTVVLQASAAKDLFTDLVNNAGVIQAGGISTQGGKVQLIASGGNAVTSGTIDVSGAQGGSVQVLSDQDVGVTGNIDASGTQGGGSIRVGGGYQGGEGLQTANATYVAPTATLNADATQSGNGGSVVVWGSQANNFYGTISARGGALGGNGGLVETSAHNGLNVQGSVDASAAHGAAGTWLLDPYDVTIVASGNNATFSNPFTAAATSSILASDINTALKGGTTVTVFTGASGSDHGDITVNAPIIAPNGTSGASSLYLEAAGSVLLTNGANSDISSDGTHALNVNLWSNYAGTGPSTTYTPGSCLSCQVQLTGASITTTGGYVDIETNGAVSLASSSSISTGGGNVSIGNASTGSVGSLSVDSTSSIDSTGGAGGNLAVLASSGISAPGKLTIGGTTSLGAGAGAISASNTGNNFTGAVSLSNSGNNNVALSNNSHALQLGTVSVGSGTLSLTGTGISQTGAVTQAAGAGLASFNGQAGVISLTNALNDFTGAVALSNSGNNSVALTNNGALQLGNVAVGRSTLTLTGVGITQASNTSITQATSAGTATFNAGAGAITLANTGNDFIGAVVLSNTGNNNVALSNGSNALQLGTVTVGTGTLALTGAGITQAGGTSITQAGAGAVTLSGGAGVITLNNSTNDFAGTVGISNSGTNAVQLNNGSNVLTLGSVNVGGSLAITSTGGIDLTQNITSGDAQTYTGAVTLANDITLTNNGSSGAIGFSSTVDSANNGHYNLGITDANDTVSFGGAVGGSWSLASLAVTGGGGITLGGNVSTVGTQSYAGTLRLSSANTTLAGSTVTVSNPISQSSKGLSISGNAAFTSTAADSLSSLSVTGTTTLDGKLTTSGMQSYTGLVTLGSSVTGLTGSSITFGNGVDGGKSTGVTFAGITTFGGNSSLAGGLTVNGATLLQGNVTSTGTQAYNGPVTLGSNATLDSTGGNVTFSAASTIDNNTTTPASLTVDAPNGLVSLGAAVGSSITNGALGGLTISSGTFSDASTLNIGAGGLSITTTGGGIAQVGAFTVSGSSSFNAGANTITLSSNNAFTGAVSLTNSGANDILLANGGVLTLGNVNVGSGNLTLTGAGIAQANGTSITQAAGAGAASFNAGIGNALTLDSSSNVFTGAVQLTGGVTTIASSGALDLGASTIGSTLTVSNSGTISQSDVLNVAGTASFTQNSPTAGTSQDILLDNNSNQFAGAVSFFAGTKINNLSFTNAYPAPGTLTLPSSVTGSLTLDYTAAALALPAIQVGGNLSATAAGAITQSGALAVTGSSIFNTGVLQGITLTDTGNAFTGAVSLNGGTAQLTNNAATVLGDSAVRSLAVISNGSITQDDSGGTTGLNVSGAASFTQNSNNADVVLDHPGNSFQGAVNFATPAGQLIRNLTLFNSFGSPVSTNLGLPGSISGNLTIDYSGNLAAITVPGTSVGGALDLTATQGITINGSETTGGSQTYHSTVTLGANATLQSNGASNNSAIDFVSDVTGLTNTLTLNTAGAVTFGGVTRLGGLSSTSGTFASNGLDIFNGGNLVINTSGAITQTGAFSVAGTSTFDAGTNSITLTDNNDFIGAVTLTGGTTQITNGVAQLTLGTLNTGALTATSGAGLNLGSGTVHGALTATSSGSISQSGVLTVTGTSNINAGSNSITLTSANDFAGAVTLTGGTTQITNGAAQLTLGTLHTGALTATSGAGLNLGSGTVNGTLTASGSGLINQSGALNVNNAATLTQNGNGQDVLLDNGSNQFKNAVSFAGTQIRNLSFTNAYATSNSNLALPASIGGNLTLTYPNASLTLQGMGTTIGGALDITANGINLDGSETTGGAQTYNGTVTLGSDATLRSTGNGDIDLTSSVSGAHVLTLNTGGNVTLGGGVSLNGLTSTSNTFTAGTLNINNGGNLAVTTTGGAIAQTGAFVVTGTSSFDAGGNAITLTDSGNSFAGAVALTGGTTQISQGFALTLGTLHTGALTATSQGDLNLGSGTVSGDLNATSHGGAISQSGALSVSGNSTINAGSGAITLANASNAFGGAVNLSGGATQITDVSALSLGTLSTGDLTATSTGNLSLGSGSIGGNLTALSNGGAISQTGALSVGGTATLDGGNGAVTLTNSSNVFTNAVTATGAGVSLNGAGNLTVASLTDNANGSVQLTAAGTLTAYGISAGSGDIALASNGGTLSTGGAISGGNISLTGLNGITSSNTITASGTLTMNSAQGGISSSGGIAAGTLTGSSGGATTLNGSNAIGTLGGFSANGFSLSNGQSLTVSGPVSGNTSATLNVTSGDLTLDSTVSGTDTALSAAGTINEGSGGGVTASTLTGSAGGAATLNGSNQVGTLGNFSAANFALIDGQALTVAGTVNGGASASLTTNGGSLAINGSVSGTNTALHSAGDISESGSMTASTLSGSAVGAATLTGNNQVSTLGNFSANGFSFTDGQSLTVNGAVNGNGNATLTTTTGNITVNGALTGNTVALHSAGAINEGGDGVNAGVLTGSSAGATTLTGINQVSTLGSFTANGFSLTNAQALTVAGPVNGGSSLTLTTTSGGITLDGAVSGAAASLNAAGTLGEGSGGVITAGTLSGNAGGATTLTGLNKVDTLGDFRSLQGFSFANDKTLTLSSVNGSSYVVNAGNSPVSFAITNGNLYQTDHTWTYDGTGSWSSTGAIGTQSNPIYVLGTTTQYVPLVGNPPAYFYAEDAAGAILPIVGDSVNIPTSLFSSRAQNVNNHLDSYIDASVITANYRSFGIVPSGILLPADQQSCQTRGGTDCPDE